MIIEGLAQLDCLKTQIRDQQRLPQYVISIGQSADQMTKASHQDLPKFEPGNNKKYKVEAICTSTPGLRFAHDQANNPVSRKAEARATDKTR